MSDATIMLATNYKSAEDLEYPLVLSEKLDGVAVDIYMDEVSGEIKVRTRQDKPLFSIDHIIEEVKTIALRPGQHICGELHIAGESFKYISGLVRRQETSDATRQLKLNLYDYYQEGATAEYEVYASRLRALTLLATPRHPQHKLNSICYIPFEQVSSPSELEDRLDKFFADNPNAEGAIMRPLYGPVSTYQAGKRSKGLVRVKRIETIDMIIKNLEEAIDQYGNPKGMVGRINAVLAKDEARLTDNGCCTSIDVFGVGPGKLSHRERIAMWNNPEQYLGRTIEIKYMPDESYDAFREARFYRFRPDRD
jgi:ATP-dependent DNA ligase